MIYAKHLIPILLVMIYACQPQAGDSHMNLPDRDTLSQTNHHTSTGTYYNYEKTTLSKGYHNSTLATFSNNSSPDCFTIQVPVGPITQTNTLIKITTANKEVIYTHTFPTSALVNGYATTTITNEAQMEEYVLNQARDIIKKGLYQPDKLPAHSYLRQADKADFTDYETWVSHQKSNRMVFHYCLNEESHYYLGYSVTTQKVVTLIECC